MDIYAAFGLFILFGLPVIVVSLGVFAVDRLYPDGR